MIGGKTTGGWLPKIRQRFRVVLGVLIPGRARLVKADFFQFHQHDREVFGGFDADADFGAGTGKQGFSPKLDLQLALSWACDSI